MKRISPVSVCTRRRPAVWVTAWLMVCIGLCHGAVARAQEPATTAEPRNIDALLETLRDEHPVPALAAALVRGDQIVAMGVSGVLRIGSKRPADLESRWHIGSCTKSMTASLMAMLVEQGKLTWETTLAEALPGVKDAMQPAYRDVTITQLLSHRAGLPPYTTPPPKRFQRLITMTGSPIEQRRAFAAEVLAEPPANEPGSQMLYSNAGYGIAGCILETVAGRPWESLMTEMLFEPLAMTSSDFGWPATKKRRRQPRGHRDLGVGPFAQALNDPYRLPMCMRPAGDVHCTIGDLARYASWHLCGLTGHARLLEPASFERLHTPAGDDQDGYGLGWGIVQQDDGPTVHRHSGSAGTFYASFILVPQRNLAVVVATNAGNEFAQQACQATYERLIELETGSSSDD